METIKQERLIKRIVSLQELKYDLRIRVIEQLKISDTSLRNKFLIKELEEAINKIDELYEIVLTEFREQDDYKIDAAKHFAKKDLERENAFIESICLWKPEIKFGPDTQEKPILKFEPVNYMPSVVEKFEHALNHHQKYIDRFKEEIENGVVLRDITYDKNGLAKWGEVEHE